MTDDETEIPTITFVYLSCPGINCTWRSRVVQATRDDGSLLTDFAAHWSNRHRPTPKLLEIEIPATQL